MYCYCTICRKTTGAITSNIMGRRDTLAVEGEKHLRCYHAVLRRPALGGTRFVTVVAPFDGRVYRRMVEVGDLAAPGRPLLMLESDGPRRLRLAVPESLVAESGLDEGDVVAVSVDSRADLGRMEANVVERSSGADPASHSFEFKLALPMDDLPTGAAGRAWVTSGSMARVVVPADALLRRGGLTLVAVRTDDGLAATRVVTVGATVADGRVEVLSGLAGGETLLAGLGAPPPAGARVEALDAATGEQS